MPVMGSFWKDSTMLFLALRAGDVVNLAAGMWLVPRFVSPEELGAVLPTTTFTTLLTLPVFAFAMAVMKESADLAGRGRRGEMKSLLRGVFVAIGLLAVLSLSIAAAAIPRFLALMRVADATAAFFIISSAILGSLAPVYTDALQALKRFRSLAATELCAAVARLATLLAAMPVRAFAGYFAGAAVQPLVRIFLSVAALRRELHETPKPYWSRNNSQILTRRFLAIAAYLMLPMFAATIEQTLLRTALPAADSAGYYMVTRLTDFLNYLTWPLLIVLFPYAAEAARTGRSTLPLVLKGAGATFAAAAAMALAIALYGERLLSLLPGGASYTGCLVHSKTLLAIGALTASQTFYTNAEVAAGRFTFLRWFVPLNLAYAAALKAWRPASLSGMLDFFLAAAALKALGCAAEAYVRSRKRPPPAVSPLTKTCLTPEEN